MYINTIYIYCNNILFVSRLEVGAPTDLMCTHI